MPWFILSTTSLLLMKHITDYKFRMDEKSNSVEKFEHLNFSKPLVAACRRRGWAVPTRFQAEAIFQALQGRDVLALAEKWSGKTGAFVLSIIQTFLTGKKTGRESFLACVLSPTRRLALQIYDEFKAIGSEIGLRSTVLIGGVSMTKQAVFLGEQPHVVVATPRRLLDHLTNTKGFSLDMLDILVLDEADRLRSSEFESILKSLPSKRSTLLFSETMTKNVGILQRACLNNPVMVEASAQHSTVEACEQKMLLVPAKYKDCYLVYILTEKERCTSMIFTRTCESARLLALLLRNLDFKAISISGQMSQQKRLVALKKFKAGECGILVCTDGASRDLDIPAVDLVINYEIPFNSKDYFRRIGCTARAGRSGLAISLLNQYESDLYLKIEKSFETKLLEYPAVEEEAVGYLERVSEARRRAQTSKKIKRKAPREEFTTVKRRSSGIADLPEQVYREHRKCCHSSKHNQEVERAE